MRSPLPTHLLIPSRSLATTSGILLAALILPAASAEAAALTPQAPSTSITLCAPGLSSCLLDQVPGFAIADVAGGSDGRDVVGNASARASIGNLGAAASASNRSAGPYNPATADLNGSEAAASWADSFAVNFPGSGLGELQFTEQLFGTTRTTALHDSTNTPPMLPPVDFLTVVDFVLHGRVGHEVIGLPRLPGASIPNNDRIAFSVPIELGLPGQFINIAQQLQVNVAAYSAGTITADYLDTAGFTSIELLDAMGNFISDVTQADLSGQFRLAPITGPAPPAIPEPGSFGMLLAAVSLWALRRLRRSC
jgi:hypothetical protein